MSDTNEEKVDYLTVDPPINGQKFCCISFVEPTVDRLAHKESYIFHKFMEQYGHILYIQFCKHHGLKPDTKMDISLDELYERYTDFKAIKYQELCNEYDEEVDNETHIRAVKVRGSYPSHKVAQMQAKKLRQSDPSFDVFVGQVGYWVPFNPININDVEPEYMEEKMQQLVKTHLDQEQKKDEVFEKRKQDMLEKINVEAKDAVEVLENQDETEIMKDRRRRKRKELPPKLKEKLQQQLKNSQSMENELVVEVPENAIELEQVEEPSVEESNQESG